MLKNNETDYTVVFEHKNSSLFPIDVKSGSKDTALEKAKEIIKNNGIRLTIFKKWYINKTITL